VKHYPDIASDIPSGSTYGIFILSDILSGKYFDILSDILSGIYADVLSGISSDILSGIRSAISSKILCGRGPARNTLILGLLFGSGRDHCDHELAIEVRRGTL
jgi:hypothetical protein